MHVGDSQCIFSQGSLILQSRVLLNSSYIASIYEIEGMIFRKKLVDNVPRPKEREHLKSQSPPELEEKLVLEHGIIGGVICT